MPKTKPTNTETRHKRVAIRIASLVEKGLDRDIIIRTVFADLTSQDVKALAWLSVQQLVNDKERQNQLFEERKAFTKPHPPQPPEYQTEIENKETKFQRLFDDPRLMYHGKTPPGGWKNSVHLSNNTDRKAFKRWCLRSIGPEAFAGWYARASAIVAQLPETGRWIMSPVEDFEADWCEEGWTAYSRNRMLGRVCDFVSEAVDEIKKETELKITAKLLATKFAVGDGRQVTWGEATIKDHETRIEMLNKTTVGTLEVIARHSLAIDKLRTNNIKTLSKLGAKL